MPVALPAHALPSVAPRGATLSRDAWRALLTRLRGAVEHTGVAFEVARRGLGVSDALDRAWRKRAAEVEAKSPTLRMGADGVLVIGGADPDEHPEVEYARIAATSDAREAARLIVKLNEVALDDSRGPAQVAALKAQLAALAPGLYGTARVEAQVSADVSAHAGPALPDQTALDAMSPQDRAAVVDAARALAAARSRLAALTAAPVRPVPEHVDDDGDGAQTWTTADPSEGDEDGGAT